MGAITVSAKVDANGVLRLELPLGREAAGRDVRVVVDEPVAIGARNRTQQDWAAWVRAVSGTIADPTFVRPDQGEPEIRESLT